MTEHAVVIAGGGPTGLMLAGELRVGGGRRCRSSSGAPTQELDELARRRVCTRARSRCSISAASPIGSSRRGSGADPELRPDPVGHQRLPDPPQLRARALADPLRAASWPAGSASSGCRSLASVRWRASRRTTPASTSSCPTARSLRADYLVGCDGGRSLIRKAAGIEFPGWDPTTSWIIAEVEMERAAGVRPAPRVVASVPVDRTTGGDRSGSCSKERARRTRRASPRCRISARHSSPPTGPTTGCTARPGSPVSPT